MLYIAVDFGRLMSSTFVVVVEEDGVPISRMGPTEGLRDVAVACLANAGLVIPDRIAKLIGRIVNSLVHYIPGIDLAFVVTRECSYRW
jgi:hypothetical protein